MNTVDKAGFTQQLIRAAWLLKFGQERSLGNTSWAIISGSWNNTDDLSACYGGPMTKGNLPDAQRGLPCTTTACLQLTALPQNGFWRDRGPLWYTPHFTATKNFFENLFTAWFGSTSDSRLFYRVIPGRCTSGEVYLQTSAGKYVPNCIAYLLNGALGQQMSKYCPAVLRNWFYHKDHYLANVD